MPPRGRRTFGGLSQHYNYERREFRGDFEVHLRVLPAEYFCPRGNYHPIPKGVSFEGRIIRVIDGYFVLRGGCTLIVGSGYGFDDRTIDKIFAKSVEKVVFLKSKYPHHPLRAAQWS